VSKIGVIAGDADADVMLIADIIFFQEILPLRVLS
jgi:hypothetical protein